MKETSDVIIPTSKKQKLKFEQMIRLEEEEVSFKNNNNNNNNNNCYFFLNLFFDPKMNIFFELVQDDRFIKEAKELNKPTVTIDI
jgi:hypothetical protein